MNKKRNIYLMYIIVFLQGFVFYGPVATIYRQNRGLSMSDIFIIESICLVLTIIFEIPWGWFSDRFGYKRTLVLSNFIFFISKIVFFEANSFMIFALERVLLAVSIAGLSGCDVAFIYSCVAEDESQKAFGRYSACATSGFLIASFMSSIIVRYSVDKTALFTIIPYGIAAILTLFIKDIKNNLSERPKFKDSFKSVLKNKHIIIFVLSLALISEVVQAISVFLNQAQYLKCGIGLKYFGVLLAMIQIVKLSAAKSHKLSAKFGKNRTIELLYIAIAISCILLIVTTNGVLSILLIAMIGASMALIGPIAADIQNKSIISTDRATILSIYAMMGDVISSISNVFIGKAADVSVESAFVVCSIMGIVGYVLLRVYKSKLKI